MPEPAMQPAPDRAYQLIFEGISQAVAQAMVPIREEITAGLRQTNRRLEKLETDVAEIRTDVAEVKGRLDRVESKLDQVLEKLG